MAPRLELQSILVGILGSSNVYFQPPPTIQMKYPCIVYRRNDESAEHANNKPYSRRTRYQVTVIHRDPDNTVRDKVADLPRCEFDRFYTADNLNHDVYNLYF